MMIGLLPGGATEIEISEIFQSEETKVYLSLLRSSSMMIVSCERVYNLLPFMRMRAI
jgi:hypothetical protein